jgi:hypothetical protein
MIPAPRPIRRFFSHLSHSLRAPESAIRSGGIRPQVVLILWSVVVLIVSQLIRADIPREFRLIPLLMIPLNLALFFLGIWAVDKNRLPDWAEASVQALAARLGITSGQFFSLLFSLFFSILTSVAAGFLFRMWSPQAAVICWGLGIFAGCLRRLGSTYLTPVGLPVGYFVRSGGLCGRAHFTLHQHRLDSDRPFRG